MMDETPERQHSSSGVFIGILAGAAPEKKKHHPFNVFRDLYRRDNTPVRYRYLNRLAMFLRQNGCPKLRGKAAEIRYFGKPLLVMPKKS